MRAFGYSSDRFGCTCNCRVLVVAEVVRWHCCCCNLLMMECWWSFVTSLCLSVSVLVIVPIHVPACVPVYGPAPVIVIDVGIGSGVALVVAQLFSCVRCFVRVDSYCCAN